MRGRLAVREEFLTSFGNMHGGVLSAFCDHMLGCVCYPALNKGQWAATTEFKINLTAPVKGGTIEARAEILQPVAQPGGGSYRHETTTDAPAPWPRAR